MCMRSHSKSRIEKYIANYGFETRMLGHVQGYRILRYTLDQNDGSWGVSYGALLLVPYWIPLAF